MQTIDKAYTREININFIETISTMSSA